MVSCRHDQVLRLLSGPDVAFCLRQSPILDLFLVAALLRGLSMLRIFPTKSLGLGDAHKYMPWLYSVSREYYTDHEFLGSKSLVFSG
jgi:hypothetical protein